MNKITAQEVTIALDELRQSLGENFQLDENGSAFLTFRDSLPLIIQFVEADGRLILVSELCDNLQDTPGEDWLRILGGDQLGIYSVGCAMSPDFENGLIRIWRDVQSTPLTGAALQEEIAAFLSQVQAAWSDFQPDLLAK